MMKAFYNDSGKLTSINDTDTGALVAVVQPDGTLHPEYDTPEAQEALAQFPAFDASYVQQQPQQPDWALFRMGVITSPAYLRIITSSDKAQAINPSLVWAIGQVEANPSELNEVVGLWNAIAQAAPPTADEIAALNQIASAAKVPFKLNEQGQMVIVVEA